MVWQTLGVVVVVLLVIGVSTPLWAGVAAVRLLHRRVDARRTASVDVAARVAPGQVAVLIAAHDEQVVLPTTLRSARRQVAAEQIFVASDASSDDTAAIARASGANVLELWPNRGKAGALAAAIEHFRLVERFEAVLLLDADTVLAADYLEAALPLFDEDDVVAVAGTAATRRDPGPATLIGRVLVGYRERVYAVTQYVQKFGQAARFVDAVQIVPGFASLYRTRVLPRIDITAPGLSIEDFNMTFEVHAKRLGRIAFWPGTAVAYTQDPATLRDYHRQVSRWALGFWQTVRRHRFRPDRFWAVLLLSIAELTAACILFVLLLPALVVGLVAQTVVAAGVDPGGLGAEVSAVLPVPLLVAGGLAPDYALTVLAAVIVRRPAMLLDGLLFPLVRLVDAWSCLAQLVTVVRSKSDGVWISPARRAVPTIEAVLPFGSRVG